MSKGKTVSGAVSIALLIVSILSYWVSFASQHRANNANENVGTSSTVEVSNASGLTGGIDSKRTWLNESYTQEWRVGGLVLSMPDSWHLDEDETYSNSSKSRGVVVDSFEGAYEPGVNTYCNDFIEVAKAKYGIEGFEVLDDPQMVSVKDSKKVTAARFSYRIEDTSGDSLYETIEVISMPDKTNYVYCISTQREWSDAELQFKHILDTISLDN